VERLRAHEEISAAHEIPMGKKQEIQSVRKEGLPSKESIKRLA